MIYSLLLVVLLSITHCFAFPELSVSRQQVLTHARDVLSNYPLVDGHNDIAWQYKSRRDNQIYGIDLTQDVNEQWGWSHTDIPRLREGQVGAQFWSAYINCDDDVYVRTKMEQVDTILRMIEKYPEDFTLVTTAQGIEDSFAEGFIGGLIGIEGGHAIDSSLAALRLFYDSGVRYLGLTHNCNTEWADNNLEDTLEEPEHGGLTDFGKTVIKEMNRLGMLVDLAHVSQATMEDTFNTSRAPIMFSHSNPYAPCNHVRNVHDENLLRLRDNGGIIMITFVPSFLACDPTPGPATIATVADHIEYVRDFIGVDYVGISGDFDGVTVTVEGLEDVSKYPDLFAELIIRGWTDEDLEKLAGRNMVRVFRDVEQVRDEMATEGVLPYEELLPGRETQQKNAPHRNRRYELQMDDC